MRYLIILIAMLFIGCQNSQKPTLLDNSKVAYANSIIKKSSQNKASNKELETKKEIALIEMKKEIESKKIEANAKIETKKIEKEKELQKAKLQLEEKEKENETDKIAIYALIFLSIGFMIFLYLLFRRHQANKIYLEQEKLRVQKELKEKELKAQTAQKILDLMSSKNLTKEQEEKLLSLMENKNILEHKK